MLEIHVSERIGRGSENNVYRKSGEAKTIKALHYFGRQWQTEDPQHTEEGNEMLANQGIKTIQTTVHQDVVLCHADGSREQRSFVIETPLIENIKERRIKYKDLLDPEIGPDLIKEMIKVIRAADKIYNDPAKPKGLDPYGGEIVTDIVKGIFPAIMLKISQMLPGFLRERIRNQIHGVEGQMRNFVKTENGPMLVDPGMHDFSENKGKYTSITKLIHNLMFASLIEMLTIANKQMPPDKQIPQKEIDSLPFNGNSSHRKTAKILMSLMFPVYEHYDEMQSRSQTRATGWSLHDDTILHTI